MHELKPSPEIYRKMIEKSGMRPEATLFIDDNAENLHTAQELGFHVYMPRPREDFRFLFDDARADDTKTENRHPKRTAHRCDTGRTFGIIRNRLQAVRLQ